MLGYPFYLWLHLAGIGLILLSIGALAGGRGEGRRMPAIAHGIGLLVVLVSGFGLLAHAGLFWPLPGWVLAKLVVWLALGAVLVLLKRRPDLATPLWWATWVAFLLAAWLGIARPF